ncbi:RNA polymerase Rpb4-domain-containing protein [Lineolata rhizophorae]|uniref:DNA-directed RNA polymerase III subunit RPC9 n=1 Tax=Lineolata rhizophorae TaxID=578093 RepID=A0A6A6P3X7_9PEZI|nr:RNA polymerase Rpb4-domain-containing protein [Lineolata rhizophorae]
MKILETQSAVLTNYEVQAHLQDMQARYQAQDEAQPNGKPKPSNLDAVMKDVITYLVDENSPLAAPSYYSEEAVKELYARLEKFNLTKAELLMILNLRPKFSALDPIIEEADVRFSEEQLQEIVDIIRDVLGGEDVPVEGYEPAENGDGGSGKKATA